MNLNNYIFLLILIFIYTNCQTYICNSNDSKDLKIGDTAYLCIHNIQNETRIAIPIEVDEYNVATIRGFYSTINTFENEIEFLAQVGNITSVFKSVSKYIILNIE